MRLAWWLTMLAALPAQAAELQLDLGLSTRKSSWRGDWTAGPQLGAGLRLRSVLALDVAVWTELGTVDRRLNTGLTLGVTGILPLEPVRPTLRGYVIHQHEEGLVSVTDQPLGALVGIGAGIRHRAGVGGRLGVEIPVARRRGVELDVLLLADVAWFPDATLGPAAYAGVTAAVGVRYGLGLVR